MELRKLLLAGVAAAAFPAYAFAQASAPASDPAAPPSASAPATPGSETTAESDASANEPRFANYKGADIVDAENNSIATIADVLIDDSGQAKALVLSEGGVMGVGATYRSFETQSLPALAGGDVKLDLTKESLAALPEYTYPKADAPASADGKTGDTATTATAPSGSTEGRAATSAMTGAAGDVASLWPVSALVGVSLEATQGEEASTQTVSDLRFTADGKVEQVELNRGGVLGVGGETQTVPFADLNISGTPDAPVLALTSAGAASAPAAPKEETERAPGAAPAPGATDGGAMAPAPAAPSPAR